MKALVTCCFFDGSHAVDISCINPAKWKIGKFQDPYEEDVIFTCDEHLATLVDDGDTVKSYDGPTHVEI